MKTANEVRVILHQNISDRYHAGQEKALRALDLVNQNILNAVADCKTNTDMYILRITSFENDTEKGAYITTLAEKIKEHGYTVAFHPSTGIMNIKWGF